MRGCRCKMAMAPTFFSAVMLSLEEVPLLLLQAGRSRAGTARARMSRIRGASREFAEQAPFQRASSRTILYHGVFWKNSGGLCPDWGEYPQPCGRSGRLLGVPKVEVHRHRLEDAELGEGGERAGEAEGI